MPRWFYSVISSVISAGLIAGAFVWYAGKPSSYDECVVSEMRGQSAQMMYRFKKCAQSASAKRTNFRCRT
jgi:hypothetical protein